MAEASSLGIVQIILHVICGLFCLGALIASVVALNTIDDLFSDDADDDSEVGQDRDQYRGTAGWLLFVAIAGIIVQVVMVIVRALYYGEVITNQFIVFAIACAIISVILALGLVSGGIPSAVNAADVQDDYIDLFQCEEDDVPSAFEDICDDLITLRNSQAASAAVAFIGAGLSGLITILVIVSTVSRRNAS